MRDLAAPQHKSKLFCVRFAQALPICSRKGILYHIRAERQKYGKRFLILRKNL